MRLIVQVQRYLTPGSLWLSELIEGLAPDTVRIVGRTQVKSELKSLPIPFTRLRSRNVLHRYLPKSIRPYSPLSGANIFIRTISQSNADRILTHFGTEAFAYMDVWRQTRLPHYVHFHGYDATFDLREMDGSGNLVHPDDYQAKIVELSRRSIFISNSDHTKEKLVSAGVCPDRIVTVHLGVKVPDQPIVKKSSEEPTVLCLGRLIDCKGPDLAVKAFTDAKSKGSPGRLIIAGDGPERINVLSAIEESPFSSSIEFLGAVDSFRARELVAAADVYLVHNRLGPITHQEEALNLSVLEAMAASTPICGTLSGGVLETNVSGETGILTKPLEIQEQGDALKTLLTQPELRKRLGKAAHARVKAMFNQSIQVQKLGDLIRSGLQ